MHYERLGKRLRAQLTMLWGIKKQQLAIAW
jgi:hypothetical protein